MKEPVWARGEETFIIHFQPDLQRWVIPYGIYPPEKEKKDMVDKPKFITDLSPKQLKASYEKDNKLSAEDLKSDCDEIKTAWEVLFSEMKALHQREALVVAKLRALKAEEWML